MQPQQRFQLSLRKSSGMVGSSEFYQDGEQSHAFIPSHLSVITCEFPMIDFIALVYKPPSYWDI